MNENPVIDSYMDKSLVRLLLANQVRELADYPRPITVGDLGRLSWLFRGITGSVFGAVGFFSRGKRRVWTRVLFTLLDLTSLVSLRLALQRLKVWQAAGNTLKTMVRTGISASTRYHSRPSSEITSYVTTTDREETLIRVCLLLRIMRRYGACVEFLLRRLRSGLPSKETRRWLSFFLSEIHDDEASRLLAPPDQRPQAAEYLGNHSTNTNGSPSQPASSTLKYGVIVPAMFDSDVFRRSLLSLLNSDFPGEVVVVEEGNHSERVCQDFCSQLPVTYVKNPTWTGTNAVANLGIETMDFETDVIVFAHSDLLWPERWFEQFDRAWDKVYHLDKVGSIHLGILEFYRASDPILGDLFLQGEYDDLVWILDAMRDSPTLMGSIADLQNNNKDRGYLFGLSMSHWTDGVPGFSVGDSVLASFPRQTWQELGGFDLAMGVGLGAELAYHDLRKRKWGLRINNTPIIHFARTDTGLDMMTTEDRAKLEQIMSKFEERFEEKYGWDYTHLSYTYRGESLPIHADEITAAVNELRFGDIDYVFDEFFQRLNTKTLSNCELTWCGQRAVCKYI